MTWHGMSFLNWVGTLPVKRLQCLPRWVVSKSGRWERRKHPLPVFHYRARHNEERVAARSQCADTVAKCRNAYGRDHDIVRTELRLEARHNQIGRVGSRQHRLASTTSSENVKCMSAATDPPQSSLVRHDGSRSLQLAHEESLTLARVTATAEHNSFGYLCAAK